jgi:hypothetical protein
VLYYNGAKPHEHVHIAMEPMGFRVQVSYTLNPNPAHRATDRLVRTRHALNVRCMCQWEWVPGHCGSSGRKGLQQNGLVLLRVSATARNACPHRRLNLEPQTQPLTPEP